MVSLLIAIGSIALGDNDTVVFYLSDCGGIAASPAAGSTFQIVRQPDNTRIYGLAYAQE